MRVKFWVHINNGGDGSAFLKVFNTKKSADYSAEREMETFGEPLCDNVQLVEIEVDADGKLTDPDSYCPTCGQEIDRKS